MDDEEDIPTVDNSDDQPQQDVAGTSPPAQTEEQAPDDQGPSFPEQQQNEQGAADDWGQGAPDSQQTGPSDDPNDVLKRFGPRQEQQTYQPRQGGDLSFAGSADAAQPKPADPDDPDAILRAFGPRQEQTSATGAGLREFARGALPVFGGIMSGAAATVGTEGLASLAAIPIGAAVTYGLQKAENSLADTLGMSDPHALLGGEWGGFNPFNPTLRAADEQQHSTAVGMGQVGQAITALRNGNAGPIVRAISGGLFGATEAVSQYIQSGKVDWAVVAASAGLGAALPGVMKMPGQAAAEELAGRVGKIANDKTSTGINETVGDQLKAQYDRSQKIKDVVATQDRATVARANDDELVSRGTAQEQSPPKPFGAAAGNGAQAPMTDGTGRLYPKRNFANSDNSPVAQQPDTFGRRNPNTIDPATRQPYAAMNGPQLEGDPSRPVVNPSSSFGPGESSPTGGPKFSSEPLVQGNPESPLAPDVKATLQGEEPDMFAKPGEQTSVPLDSNLNSQNPPAPQQGPPMPPGLGRVPDPAAQARLQQAWQNLQTRKAAPPTGEIQTGLGEPPATPGQPHPGAPEAAPNPAAEPGRVNGEPQLPAAAPIPGELGEAGAKVQPKDLTPTPSGHAPEGEDDLSIPPGLRRRLGDTTPHELSAAPGDQNQGPGKYSFDRTPQPPANNPDRDALHDKIAQEASAPPATMGKDKIRIRPAQGLSDADLRARQEVINQQEQAEKDAGAKYRLQKQGIDRPGVNEKDRIAADQGMQWNGKTGKWERPWSAKLASGKIADQSPAPPSEGAVARFMKDEKGFVNVDKVTDALRNTSAPIAKGLGYMMEHTFGVAQTDLGRSGDAAIARGMAERQAIKTGYLNKIATVLDGADHQWNRDVSTKDNIAFRNAFQDVERTAPGLAGTILPAKMEQALRDQGVSAANAKWMAQRAPLAKQLYDQFFTDEAKLGSNSEYKDKYLQGLYSNTPEFNDWLAQRRTQLGPTAFQKEKVFDTIQAAERAGFKPQYSNFWDMLAHRAQASADMQGIMRTMKFLEDRQGAVREDSSMLPEGAMRWKQYIDPVGTKWRVSPDVEPIFHNMIATKGLWQANTLGGSIFRKLMQVKAAWIPVKLGLSLFHYTHLATVAAVQPIIRGMYEQRNNAFDTGIARLTAMAKGTLQAPGSFLYALPLQRLPKIGKVLDQMTGGRFSEYPGRRLKELMNADPRSLSQDDADLRNYLIEGGQMVGRNPQEYIGNAKHALQRAMADGQYQKTIIPGVQKAIQLTSSAMFEDAIPALKITNYLQDVQAFARNHPDIMGDDTQRAIALRTIGKQADDRFGEMFYDNLGWNKMLKDVAQFSSVSLGWNLGYARQAGGALTDLAQNALNKTGIVPYTEAQKTMRSASNRASYAVGYTASGMLMSGALTYALTGKTPSDFLDYFYPKDGYKNADGSDHRMTTMYNTRDVFAAKAHAEERNSAVGGFLRMLQDKFITGPFFDAVHNRDFFGNQLYDTNAPAYKQALQLVDSMLKEMWEPASVSGAFRASDQGTGLGGAARAVAGFAPAPKYIYNDALQNRVNELYQDSLPARPYAKSGGGLVQDMYNSATGQSNKSQFQQRHDAQIQMQKALQSKDPDQINEAKKAMKSAGASNAAVKGAQHPENLFKYKFSRLAPEYQRDLVKQMNAAQYQYYVQHGQVSAKTRRDLRDYYSPDNE